MVTARGGQQALVLQFYEAAVAGNIAAAVSLLHEDFRIEGGDILPWGGTHQGRDVVVAQVLAPLAAAIDLGSARVQSIYGEGERVFATIAAAAAGGEQVLIGEDWTVEDGLLRAVRVFWFDPTPVMSPHAGAIS